jgi:hypothetical protein
MPLKYGIVEQDRERPQGSRLRCKRGADGLEQLDDVERLFEEGGDVQ